MSATEAPTIIKSLIRSREKENWLSQMKFRPIRNAMQRIEYWEPPAEFMILEINGVYDQAGRLRISFRPPFTSGYLHSFGFIAGCEQFDIHTYFRIVKATDIGGDGSCKDSIRVEIHAGWVLVAVINCNHNPDNLTVDELVGKEVGRWFEMNHIDMTNLYNPAAYWNDPPLLRPYGL